VRVGLSGRWCATGRRSRLSSRRWRRSGTRPRPPRARECTPRSPRNRRAKSRARRRSSWWRRRRLGREYHCSAPGSTSSGGSSPRGRSRVVQHRNPGIGSRRPWGNSVWHSIVRLDWRQCLSRGEEQRRVRCIIQKLSCRGYQRFSPSCLAECAFLQRRTSEPTVITDRWF